MSQITHANIIPLIGGLAIGQERALGCYPLYTLSYKLFESNDSHYRNYRINIPYYAIDNLLPKNLPYAEVIGTVPPCAGLSSLSTTSHGDSKVNDWMYITAELALSKLKPSVFWGENSPNLITKKGLPVLNKLRKIGLDNGYALSVYRTSSLYHGLPQNRNRCFYLFWKGDKVPEMKYINREYIKLEDLIRNVKKQDTELDQVVNTKTPSKDDGLYAYVLNVLEKGITHQEYQRKINHTTQVGILLKEKKINFNDVASWLDSNGYAKEANKCRYMQGKFDVGKNAMIRYTEVPREYINAFVGSTPNLLAHPDEDRYLTYREALKLMSMPNDFVLLNPKRTLNHICQNVPVITACDIATSIKLHIEGKLNMLDTNFAIQYNMGKKNEIVTKMC